MGISSIEDVVKYNRLRWFGHLQLIDEEKWPMKTSNFEVNGSSSRGRPKKRWFDNIRRDLDKLRLSTYLALDRVKWRNAIKPSRHVAESNPRCQRKEGRSTG